MRRTLTTLIGVISTVSLAQYETGALTVLQKKCTACHSLPRADARKILRVIERKLMPPPYYVSLHPESALSEEELKTISDWASKEG